MVKTDGGFTKAGLHCPGMEFTTAQVRLFQIVREKGSDVLPSVIGFWFGFLFFLTHNSLFIDNALGSKPTSHIIVHPGQFYKLLMLTTSNVVLYSPILDFAS